MSVCCHTIISLLERYAPKYIAEPGDPIGLQVGDPGQEIQKVYVTLDLNEAVLDEAEEWGADLLLVHHTPFYKPLPKIRTDLQKGRLIARIIRNNMALYAAHTNLDSADQGVNAVLAGMLGLSGVTPLADSWQQQLYKLVVFVPESHSEQVRQAITASGAGWIGNYSDCTFRVKGTGTFRPLEGTNPYIGQQGQVEAVPEERIETILPAENCEQVIKAMLKAHPYEEVAYDLYPLLNKGKINGLGRVGYLPQAITLAEFLGLVKTKLNLQVVKYCGDPASIIKKVALCGGAGASLLNEAVYAGADVYLTGDLKYHEAQEALLQNMAVVDAGHFATEYPVVARLADYLRHALQDQDVEIKASEINTDPFRYYWG